MANTYGIEAALKILEKEIKDVFAAYGILFYIISAESDSIYKALFVISGLKANSFCLG